MNFSCMFNTVRWMVVSLKQRAAVKSDPQMSTVQREQFTHIILIQPEIFRWAVCQNARRSKTVSQKLSFVLSFIFPEVESVYHVGCHSF